MENPKRLCQTGVTGLSLTPSLLTRKEWLSSSKVNLFYTFGLAMPNWICIYGSIMNLVLSGSHLWKGFQGPAQPSNETFKELDDIHHIGHVDAAFRMHSTESPDTHDHIYFFLVWTADTSTYRSLRNHCRVCHWCRLVHVSVIISRMTKCSAITTTPWRTGIPKRSRRSSPESPLTWMRLLSVPVESAGQTRLSSSRVSSLKVKTMNRHLKSTDETVE